MGRLPIAKNDYAYTVYTTNDNSVAYYNKMSRGQLNEMVPVADQKIWVLMSTLYLRKHSCLVPLMDAYIEQFIAHGFVSKWVSDHSGPRRKKGFDDRDPQVLTLEQVLGLVYICMGLYALAILVFVTELLSVRFELSWEIPN